jgi:glycerophosphoryl diester phosphodiesterase
MFTIVAHRGLHDEFIENSLPAFCNAWSKGIHWCECDVHLSADDQPVVLHDDTLDRTTGGHGPVSSYNLAQLRFYGVPSLHEVIKAMPPAGGLLVEYKPTHPPNHPALMELAHKLTSPNFILQSFNLDQILGIWRRFGPKLDCAMLSEDLKDLDHPAAKELPRIHLRHDLLTPSLAHQLRDRGKSLGVWTPNEDAEIARAIHMGVSMIITDRPHWRPTAA